MIALTLRVFLVYTILLLATRIMGKREIGQLSTTDFVVAIVVAELATLPITDQKMTLEESLIPIIIITMLEVMTSFLCLKSNRFRRFIYGRPNLLIADGKMQMQEMRKARYNIDDLLCQLRQHDIFDVSQVDYAVLETSGDLTVLLKPEHRPVTAGDMQINKVDVFAGLPLTLVDDGEINMKGMEEAGLTLPWLEQYLKSQQVQNYKDVFFASIGNNGRVYLMTRAEAMAGQQEIH